MIDRNECSIKPSLPSKILSSSESLSSASPVQDLLQADYAETFFQKLVDVVPVELSAKEQNTDNSKKGKPLQIADAIDTCETEKKETIEQEISNTLTKSQKIRKLLKRKQTKNIEKTDEGTKRRKRKGCNGPAKITKQNEQEDHVDVETASDEVPGIC